MPLPTALPVLWHLRSEACLAYSSAPLSSSGEAADGGRLRLDACGMCEQCQAGDSGRRSQCNSLNQSYASEARAELTHKPLFQARGCPEAVHGADHQVIVCSANRKDTEEHGP